MLGGHRTEAKRRTDIYNGHAIYTLLANYQAEPKGGNGWLRLLRFSPQENKIHIETYSPYLDHYKVNDDNWFTLDYDMNKSLVSLKAVNKEIIKAKILKIQLKIIKLLIQQIQLIQKQITQF